MAAIFIMDSVNANTLTEVTTVPTNKKLIFTDPDTNEGGIITMENLTKQVLQNLTSQQFTLDAGQMTIPTALNALNGKSFINMDISSGKKYDLDNYKGGLYCFVGVDTGNNTGTALPDVSVSIVSQIGNIQIAAAMNQSYYIRYYWGEWKQWKKIT
mgnify:CR=1 FL=1